MKQVSLLAASIVLAASSLSYAQSGRDQINIVGSSTVFPFATLVAERFGKDTQFKTPKIESTGSGGGLKLFCAGLGATTPDIANASRAIKSSEIETCAKNGVKEITEVRFGYDGIVFANSLKGPDADFNAKQIFLALANKVPSQDGKSLIDNPYKNWSEIDPKLPNEKIEVLGPPPTSGTRDAFVELVMDKGCAAFPVFETLDKDAKKAACQGIRTGAYIEAGENDNLIVQKLSANPAAFGIFGFSYLEQNPDKIKGAAVDGVKPTFDNIASGKYPVSRSLYFYIKNAHVGMIPGLHEYAKAFVSDDAAGMDGYLVDAGLIPLPEADLKKTAKVVEKLVPLKK